MGSQALWCALSRRSYQTRANDGSPAGRQLFEQGALTRESDAAFGDEGDVSLDISQYERTGAEEEEEEAVTERLRLAELSDDE